MTWLDVGVLAVVVISSIRGALRGLIREAFGLAGIILAIYFGLKFSGALVGLFPSLAREPVAKAVAFVIIFILVTLLANLLGRLAARAVHAVALGFLDRLLGTALGFLEGFAFAGVVLYLLSSTPFGARAIQESLWGLKVLGVISGFIARLLGPGGEGLDNLIRIPRHGA